MENMDSTPPGDHRRHVKNYLIDRRYQLTWVWRVAILVTAIVMVMGYFLYDTLSESIQLISVQMLGSSSLTDEAQSAIIQKGQKDKLFAGLVLGGSLAGLVLVLCLLTIVVTHRVAGPLHKIKRLLATVEGSRLQLWEQLRRGDEMRDVFEEFSRMLKRLRDARRLDVERLTLVVRNLESAGVARAHYAALEDILLQYRASINMDDQE